jgi:hypothetical protein
MVISVFSRQLLERIWTTAVPHRHGLPNTEGDDAGQVMTKVIGYLDVREAIDTFIRGDNLRVVPEAPKEGVGRSVGPLRWLPQGTIEIGGGMALVADVDRFPNSQRKDACKIKREVVIDVGVVYTMCATGRGYFYRLPPESVDRSFVVDLMSGVGTWREHAIAGAAHKDGGECSGEEYLQERI